MLSDAELDTALSDVERMGDTAVLYIKYFERLITQAKLANQLQEQLEKTMEVATKEAEKRFCEAIIATQEISKTNGHLTCDVALLLTYYNDHKPKN